MWRAPFAARTPCNAVLAVTMTAGWTVKGRLVEHSLGIYVVGNSLCRLVATAAGTLVTTVAAGRALEK